MKIKTAQAFVIGNPVSHSLSPQIFNYFGKELKTPVQYGKLCIEKSDYNSIIKILGSSGSHGCNITIPFKETALKKATIADVAAQKIGAANLIKFNQKNSQIKAYNTDYLGIMACIKEKKFVGSTAAVFGAGGAARAAVYALGKLHYKKIFVLNRSEDRAKKLCQQLQNNFKACKVVPLALEQSAELKEIDLFFNTIPFEITVKSLKHPLLPKNLKKSSIAFDASYGKKSSIFLKQAKKQNLKIIDGLDMLVWQAIFGWDIWFGKIANKQKLKAKTKKHLLENII